MNAVVELDKKRQDALTKLARRRKTSKQKLLEKAVDEFLLQLEYACPLLTQMFGLVIFYRAIRTVLIGASCGSG